MHLGCDTGFGHILAKRLAAYGFHVFAGCLFPNGDGAKRLKQENDNITIIGLDVTKDESVFEARKSVEKLIGEKSNIK